MFLRASQEAYQIQKTAHMRGSLDNPDDTVYDFTRASNNPTLFSAYRDKVAAERVKDALCNRNVAPGDLLRFGDDLLVEPDIFLIRLSGAWYKGHTAILIGVLDMMQAWHLVLLYNIACNISRKYGEASLFDKIANLKAIWLRLRERLGERVYDILATWEPGRQ